MKIKTTEFGGDDCNVPCLTKDLGFDPMLVCDFRLLMNHKQTQINNLVLMSPIVRIVYISFIITSDWLLNLELSLHYISWFIIEPLGKLS